METRKWYTDRSRRGKREGQMGRKRDENQRDKRKKMGQKREREEN